MNARASSSPSRTPPDGGDSRFDEIWRRLDKLESTVFYGNGQPPITSRLAALERGQATQTWLLRVIVGGVVADILGLAFLVLRGTGAGG